MAPVVPCHDSARVRGEEELQGLPQVRDVVDEGGSLPAVDVIDVDWQPRPGRAPKAVRDDHGAEKCPRGEPGQQHHPAGVRRAADELLGDPLVEQPPALRS
eukprot:CAMPEP_0182853418 /NCGR_PEP_ID=MMETSP0034_2-20130328/691_1 /TAXON_ID=156128 /ORGANISM="Nephroselmis pyriformis, Strain CCMP717" /LENGTH=100 /DNA_ID=CAMNT_0024984189 /DNA_START=245 /DNA_END=547 /DNA_ORIENTATION=+